MMQNAVKTMPPDAFERLGDGQIAYVRPLLSEEVHDLFPQAATVPAPSTACSMATHVSPEACGTVGGGHDRPSTDRTNDGNR